MEKFIPFESVEQVIEAIKKHQKPEKWVIDARESHKTLKALVYGDKFDEILITKIEKIESAERAEARKKYSKDIRDMFSRVLEPRNNIFSASGGSVEMEISGQNTKNTFVEHLHRFKGNKSLFKYLSEYFFKLLDVDPNGLIMLEYLSDEQIYPAYKSINDIRHYISNGQNIEMVIFEPVDVHVNGLTYKKWRVIDSLKDYCILQNAEVFIEVDDATFTHPFGDVPAVILSDFQKLGTENRLSPLFPVEELSKDYARDKSVLTLYKFLQGFPIHWRYNQQCRACNGIGKTGVNASTCKTCNGHGYIGKNDVTDVINVPTPRDNDDAKIAPDLAGFVSPDLKTWEAYNSDLREFEKRIENTIWGTHRIKENGNETATGRFIDVQPVMNKLNDFSDNVQWVHNELAKWVLNWVKATPQHQDNFHRSYGRNFIIESPDTILKKYQEARKDGENFTVLDKLLHEYILSKYRNNPSVLENTLKKAIVEPYIHLGLETVNNIFGNAEAQRKQLFGAFWEQADKTRDVEQLKADFEAFYNDNRREVAEPLNGSNNPPENE